MATTPDAIVIGSGFGGAVVACRLAEAGARVLVLERGRRWTRAEFPRAPDDPWWWDARDPVHSNGWLDLRPLDGDMWVAQGAGVGGGSLVYANVFIPATEAAFERGWPREITLAELAPHYATTGRMLGVQYLPVNQITERYKLVREAAGAIDAGARFRPLELAVNFSPRFHAGLADPTDPRHVERFINAEGIEQGTCNHCGNCDIGCDVNARNTLDLNYLARAERLGAEIRALHLVSHIAQEADGYRVFFDRIENGERLPGSEQATRVVLAAGSIGSTEILLRSRDAFGSLPQLGPALGHGWSANGDFLTPAFYPGRRISPTQGPTITCAIDFLDGSENGARFFVEDGGFPNLLAGWIESQLGAMPGGRFGRLWRELRERTDVDDPVSSLMPWFGQGMDGASGRLRLGREFWRPWVRKLRLDWDPRTAERSVNGLIDMHRRLSAATGGQAWVPPTWEIFRMLVTPHPLGGCNMGDTRADGVVDHRCEVFGHPNLFVVDGAVVPRPIGLNPSRTIAALAERASALMTA